MSGILPFVGVLRHFARVSYGWLVCRSLGPVIGEEEVRYPCDCVLGDVDARQRRNRLKSLRLFPPLGPHRPCRVALPPPGWRLTYRIFFFIVVFRFAKTNEKES